MPTTHETSGGASRPGKFDTSLDFWPFIKALWLDKRSHSGLSKRFNQLMADRKRLVLTSDNGVRLRCRVFDESEHAGATILESHPTGWLRSRCGMWKDGPREDIRDERLVCDGVVFYFDVLTPANEEVLENGMMEILNIDVDYI